jgi:hypothetical protein
MDFNHVMKWIGNKNKTRGISLIVKSVVCVMMDPIDAD